LSRKKLAVFLILLVLFIDQFSKIWIKSHFSLTHSDINIFQLGFIEIEFIENPGMAFGFSFGNIYGKYLLSLFRIGAVFAIGWYLLKLISIKTHFVFIACVSLIFAGALGNILDSLFYGLMFDSGTVWDPLINGGDGRWIGYPGISNLNFKGYAGMLEGCVVDMIHFNFEWPSWAPFGLKGEVFPPVFNVADFAISFSVGVIVVFYKKIVRDEDVNFKALFKLRKDVN
tara:strand:- start:832 stop:1515 length:684 start_codon:yes stop_codon:yes gene_type:complete